MDIVKNIIEFIKSLILNKSFLIGFVICIAVFSKYIFGNDNLLEQFGEKILKDSTGMDVDFSPSDPQPPSNVNTDKLLEQGAEKLLK